VAKLQNLTTLILSVEDTQTTNAGVAELRKALSNCKIVTIINPPRETP